MNQRWRPQLRQVASTSDVKAVAGCNGQAVVTAEQVIVGAMLSRHPVGRTPLHLLLDQCRGQHNAFTNVMARWNLRAGADAADRAGMPSAETVQWRELASRLVDGYDPATRRYEQFVGYFALEPLLIGDVAVPPVAADLLLGRDRVTRSQLIKQPDVLMLHHLVPDQVEPGSLGPNLDYYGPRTAHGSSLSPAVTAALLARAGRPDEALTMLRMALALDLDDLTGMTGAGLHMANLGGIWQAGLAGLAGLAGVRVRAGVLTADPRLPAAWDGLRLRFRCLGRKVRMDRGAVRPRRHRTGGPARLRRRDRPEVLGLACPRRPGVGAGVPGPLLRTARSPAGTAQRCRSRARGEGGRRRAGGHDRAGMVAAAWLGPRRRCAADRPGRGDPGNAGPYAPGLRDPGPCRTARITALFRQAQLTHRLSGLPRNFGLKVVGLTVFRIPVSACPQAGWKRRSACPWRTAAAWTEPERPAR